MNPRDPDLLQIIDKATGDIAALQANVISRWGRVPHVAADPASPPDGGLWIRSDNGNLSWRANGVTSPSVWTAPTLINSWTNIGGGFRPAQYRKVGDIVYIRGVINGGVLGATAFVLPLGFRPLGDGGATPLHLPGGGGTYCDITVFADGSVIPNVGSTAAMWINVFFSTLA